MMFDLQDKNMEMERCLILAGGGARGAFQVGALQFLQEMGWKPEMICGSSVGAINAAAIGSGTDLDELARLWRSFDRHKIYKITLKKFILTFLGGRKFNPVMDTGPLRAMLTEHINMEALRKSRTEIIVTAVNMLTSELRYFDNRVINVEHIMASSAMPMFFPYQFIDGEPYWDGGVMANVPIMPALKRGAKEIIVVLLSPVGVFKQPLPRTHADIRELILEHFLIGSYNTLCCNLSCENVRIAFVAPTRMLGLRSLLNFSPDQSEKLIQEGYDNAREQLSQFFGQ